MPISKINLTSGIAGVLPSANATYSTSRKNTQPLIINGDMAVAQRNTGTVAQADGSNEGYATVDRMQTTFGNSAGGTITTSRDTTAPTGFGQSMKFDVTSADTSVGSTHIVYTEHTLEAQVIRNSGWDYTSSSSYLTLSFQIRSSKTGTYCVFLQTNDGTAYQYTQEYTISSADTWEQKVLTFPGNSNLTFNNDSGKGLIVAWVWAVGSSRYGSAGSWTTSNAYGTSNQVNFLDNTSNVAYITGVQLEVGQFTSSTLPAFQHESFGENLKRCQRYFWKADTSTNARPFCMGRYWSADNVGGLLYYPVTMRTAPTVTWVNPTNGWLSSGGTGSSNDYFTDIVTDAATSESVVWYTSGTSADGTAGYGTIIYTGTGGGREMNCDAEL